VGGNVSNVGQRSLAQVGAQQVDLSLLRQQKDLDGPVTDEWIAGNLKADRTVQFGSEEYFALAADPEARPYLQSGRNVVFAYQGQIIAIQDTSALSSEPDSPQVPAHVRSQGPDGAPQGRSVGIASMGVSALRLAVYVAALLLCLVISLALCLVAMLVFYHAWRERILTGDVKR